MISTSMSLTGAFYQVAAEHSEREALVCDAGRFTYGELAAQVEALAAGLAQMGIGQGERVATLLPADWHQIIVFFATARLGAVVVPLNPQLRSRQLQHILAEVEPAILFCADRPDTAEDLDTIRQLRGQVPSIRQIILTDRDSWENAGPQEMRFTELLAGSHRVSPERDVSPDDLAVILYTSGTTGWPKGVMHSHRGLIGPVVASLRLRQVWLHRPSPAQLARMAGIVARYGLRLLQAAGRPQTFLTAIGSHAIAGIEIMLQGLLMGDRIILMRHFHPTQMLEWIARERVTILIAVPLALSILVRMRDIERYDLSSLLICGTGSAPCTPELARQVQAKLGCAIHIGFGTTEIGGGIAATSLEDSDDRQAETVGRAMAGVEIRIVDEQRQPLPSGQIGELACRSESRMLGYYRAPDLYGEVVDQEGWYYTGDLAIVDEQGFIRIVGRKKDLIIRGGQNIYPAEIEQCITACPGIRETAVVGVPDRIGDEEVWAFVILEPGVALTAQQILAYCREQLEPYKIPSQVRIRSDLPRSSLGKVQKTVLRAEALQETEQIQRPEGRKGEPT